MDASDDDLLPFAEEFDLLVLLRGPTRRDEVDGDLGEGLFGSEGDRAFGRQADADQNVAAFLVVLAHMVFDRTNSILIENVEVERRHQPGERAGVECLRPGARPNVDLLWCDLLQLLPAGQPSAVVILAVSGRLLAVERDRAITGFAQPMTQDARVYGVGVLP